MNRTIFDGRTATPEELSKFRRFAVGAPEDAQTLTRPNLDGIIFTWERQVRGRTAYHVAAFAGKSGKPQFFIYTYKKADADKKVEDFFTGLERAAAYKAQQRAVAHAGPDMTKYTVGAILHVQFGYDMTLNEYYQVVEVKGRSVVIREIGTEIVSGDAGYTGMERPVKDAFLADKPEMKKIVTLKGVKIDHKHAHPWDGQPDRFNYMD